MRWSRAVALLVVGVLVSQLAPTASVGAEDPGTRDVPSGTIVVLGEITGAEDFGVHNFLTGLDTEQVAAEYLGYDYEITENEFQLLLFPSLPDTPYAGSVVAHGIVSRDVEARYRLWWQGREEYSTFHVAFSSSIEFTFEAIGAVDRDMYQGPFTMVSVPTVRVNEVSTPSLGALSPCSSVAEGVPCAVDPSGQVEVQAPHVNIEGRVSVEWQPGTGELTAELRSEGYPGVLTLEGVGVHVEGGDPGRGGLLWGEGVHGIDQAALKEAFSNCEGSIGWRATVPTPLLEEALKENPDLGSVKQLESAEQACQMFEALFWVPWHAVAPRILELSQLLQSAASPDEEQALFPALTNPGVQRVIAVLAQNAMADPLNPRLYTALVKFFNFNLRLHTACSGEECPA